MGDELQRLFYNVLDLFHRFDFSGVREYSRVRFRKGGDLHVRASFDVRTFSAHFGRRRVMGPAALSASDLLKGFRRVLTKVSTARPALLVCQNEYPTRKARVYQL